MTRITNEILKERQAWPLKRKIEESLLRIREWYTAWEGKVHASVSGKDSCVMLHIIRSEFPEVPAVFVNTGLEYPEIVSHIKSLENEVILHPKIPFHQIVEKYGYPVVSKRVAQYVHDCQSAKNKDSDTVFLRKNGITRSGKLSPMSKIPYKWQYLIDAPFKISDKCCGYLKHGPLDIYSSSHKSAPFIGTMASNSCTRTQTYLGSGCNRFDQKHPISAPLSFWLEKDIWDYIRLTGMKYPTVYDMGYPRTGCMFCAFGVHMEKGVNRFQRMEMTHPKQYKYCMEKLGMREVLTFLNVKSSLSEEDFLK